MKRFLSILVLAIVASTGNIYAQYAGDALRFSQTNYGSSSRFKGLGNAQISLGGDISSLGGNPAGLGMFTRSEFAFTPEFDNTQSKANYLGTTTNSTKNQLNVSQVGAVWYNPAIKSKGSDLNKGLVSAVFGVGYNRNNDFTNEVTFGGRNTNSSIRNYFAEQANGTTLNNLADGTLGAMAYDTFLIEPTATGSTTYNPSLSATGLANNQSKNEVRSGSTSELNFAGALNFSNQFYIGASIGIVNVRYQSDAVFNETGLSNIGNEQDGRNYNLSYNQSQQSDGTGINARLGLIFKPVNTVRIGATFQSPTWMRIEDNYAESLNSRFTSGSDNDYVEADPYGYNFQYSIRTPYKGSLGASVILGNHGLLSADIDYIDYSSIKLSTVSGFNSADDRNAVMFDNMDVKEFYTSAINYRVGGEYKIGDMSLRAGFGLNGSPYKDDDANVFDTKYYSGGLGYRFSQCYVDLAYQRVETNNTFVPYTLSNQALEPTADVKLSKNNVFLTFGVKF